MVNSDTQLQLPSPL